MKRILLCLVLLAAGQALASTIDLVGLWEAKKHFGPEVRGELVLVPRDGGLVAEIAGFSVPAETSGQGVAFTLPDGHGAFRARAAKPGQPMHGFWIQPRSPTSGLSYATPITLRMVHDVWRGEVQPLEQTFTFYLPVTRAANGALTTFLRNPERNDGIFARVKTLEQRENRVVLHGSQNFEGPIQDGRFALRFPRGGLYEFKKVEDHAASPFYPRGGKPARYRYAKPLQRDDGWPVATLEEVGLSRAAIEAFIQRIIDTPMDSLHASQIHSVLIARHGKLVLEEYFHGHHRDQPHDTRSAAKSVLAVLVGAAMHAGIPVGESTPVYETMLGKLPEDIDPRKRAMTLEHLLTMTGGHFCGDNNPNAPGNEDVMQSQDRENDWYRYILALPMDRTPGEKLVYCSVDPHLGGGVLAKVAKQPLPELFDRLVARPLKMGRHHMLLAPTGEGYMGGGSHFLPRDFLKLAQLMVNEGRWGEQRIFTAEWARKSGAALRDLSSRQQYGYLWNSVSYPFRDSKVRGIFAGGNGGQISMAIPELGLAIAFTGGSYADPVLFVPQRRFVPEEILPAIQR